MFAVITWMVIRRRECDFTAIFLSRAHLLRLAITSRKECATLRSRCYTQASHLRNILNSNASICSITHQVRFAPQLHAHLPSKASEEGRVLDIREVLRRSVAAPLMSPNLKKKNTHVDLLSQRQPRLVPRVRRVEYTAACQTGEEGYWSSPQGNLIYVSSQLRIHPPAH